MGIYDSSIHLTRPSTIAQTPNNNDSFDSSKLPSNEKHLSKNLNSSVNIDKKNTKKLNMANLNIDFLRKHNYSKNAKSKKNFNKEQMNKISFNKGINTSKTVDKKQIYNNLETTLNNSKNENLENSNKNSLDKKKMSINKKDSKKILKTTEKIKNININNININNQSNKYIKPFYYKPTSIFKNETNINRKINHKSNMDTKIKINKSRRLNHLDLTNSKEKILTKNGSIKKIDNLTRTDIHRSYNNISRISSKDKINLANDSYSNKKVTYKLEHIIDVHNYYNDLKYKPIYIIDDTNNSNKNKKDVINYSTEKEYNEIIRNKEINNLNKIYIELLKLKERKWQDDLISISRILSSIRTPKNKTQEININYILQKTLLLFDHFHWIMNSISFVFSSLVYENKNDSINNYYIESLNFPCNDINYWLNGFEWKGLYIRIDKNINCINNIKKEIKALKYFFLDFIHIIWNNELLQDLDINSKCNILSNNIIFPLIGYCQINSFILIVSSIIKPETNNINFNKIIEESSGKIELLSKINRTENIYISGNKTKNSCKFQSKYNTPINNKNNNDFNYNSININEFSKKKLLLNKLNHSIDYNTNYKRNESINDNDKITEIKSKTEKESDKNVNSNVIEYFINEYYINDLLKSKLFSELNKNNLVKVAKGKFILINIAEYLPNLFEIKFKNDIKKMNFYGGIKGEKKFVTLNYNTSSLINLKNIIESKNNIKNNIGYYNTITPKMIFEKIYKLFPSPNMKLKNVKIGNLFFRILFLNADKNKKNSKKKFIDFLFNYHTYIEKNNNNYLQENENNFIHIQEPYVIIYDLIEPIKLDYSLIKSIKAQDKKTEVINDIFFLRTNYMDYFMSWCDMFNKNSFNIKRYCDLKYYMRKFGINHNLAFFAMVKINNEEISDIIKIHFLVKAFKFICGEKDYKKTINKFKKIIKYKNLYLYENLKSKILIYIKSVIYPNEILPSYKNLFKSIYEQLLFFSNILFIKFKLIDDYLSLGLINVDKQHLNKNKEFYSFFHIKSPEDFLKHCILIARKKPFLFISEIENKLNVLIDPFIKFKSSISIESMSRKLDIFHIDLNNIIIKSYVDPNEISGLILTKIISKNKSTERNTIKNISTLNSYINKSENSNINKIFNRGIENDNLKISNIIYSSNPNRKLASIESINNNKYANQNNKYKEGKIEFEYEIKNNNVEENQYHNINNNENNEIKSKMSSDKNMDLTDVSSLKINMDKNKFTQKNNNLEKIDDINFKEINENIIFILPANCHKIMFNFEKNKMQKRNEYLYSNLNIYYSIDNIQIIKDWVEINENIFKSITNSNNFKYENILMKSYMFLFLYEFYFEKNKKDFMHLNTKLLSLFKNNIQYHLSLNEIAIINIIQALIKNNYIQNEEYFSKCVMLLLMNYGDPRGRHNDSHGILQFPLWEIARKTYKLDEPIINENFKEMYQALDFFEKYKGIYNITPKKNNDMFNHNFSNSIRNYIDKIKAMNLNGENAFKKETKNFQNKSHDESNDTEFVYSMINNIEENPNDISINKEINKDLTDLDLSLNKLIFDRDYIKKICIEHYIFPSISCKISNVGRVFYRKEFIIYFIKEIFSLFLDKGTIYNKKYLDKKISEDLIINKDINVNDKPLINQEKTRENSKNSKYNETPIKAKNINNVYLEKKIPNSSLRANPYLKIDKKYNNRNFQNYQKYNLFITEKSSKSYNNCMNKSNIVNNATKINININSNKSRKAISNKNNNNNILINNELNNKKNNINANSNNIKSKNIFSNFLYIELFQKLSYKKNLPSGIIISCGNNKHNETSHDRYEKLTLPRVIFKLKNEIIDKIYSGWEHNIVLNNKGEIFSFGHNQYYQCGLPKIEKKGSIYENINDPTNISILNNNLKAIKVSCGNEHNLIISQDKNVYGFGSNDSGLLGLKDTSIKTYKPIKLNFTYKISTNKTENYDGKIIDISSGTMHNLALTDDGKVFSWGSIQGGQLGLPSDYLVNLNKKFKFNSEQNFYISTPSPIPYFLANNIKISQISCGEAHCLALNNKGKAYSWGFGSNGQLGLGFCEDCFEPGEGLTKSRIFEPQLINIYKDYNPDYTSKKFNNNSNFIKIKEIKCGKTFSMFISNNNDLFACGINDLGQLGFKDIEKKDKLYNQDIQCDDYIYPSLLRSFDKRKVEKISCGDGHCFAIIKDLNSNLQTIWSWGNNKFGQIGHGMMVKVSLPKEVEYLTEYNMNNFSDVSCGGFHSLILLKSKNNVNWIENDYDELILGIFKEIGDLY